MNLFWSTIAVYALDNKADTLIVSGFREGIGRIKENNVCGLTFWRLLGLGTKLFAIPCH